MTAARASHRGFSLLELLTIVAIVTVMAGLAGSSFGGILRQNRVNEQARRLVSLAQVARVRSLSQGLEHGLYIGGAADFEFCNKAIAPKEPDYCNRVILFGKKQPTLDESVTTFEPALDNVLEVRTVDLSHERPLATNEARTVDLSNVEPLVEISSGVPKDGALLVVFNQDGAPRIANRVGGATVALSLATPLRVSLRAPKHDLTSRTVELRADGLVRIVK